MYLSLYCLVFVAAAAAAAAAAAVDAFVVCVVRALVCSDVEVHVLTSVAHGVVGKQIAEIQKEGKLVPSEITVELIRKAIEADLSAPGYLIDGFPRNITQADMFEEGICRARAILNLDAGRRFLSLAFNERLIHLNCY